jgi:hypothetical protein
MKYVQKNQDVRQVNIGMRMNELVYQTLAHLQTHSMNVIANVLLDKNVNDEYV